MELMAVPFTVMQLRGNRDPAFGLLGLKVHIGRAIINLAKAISHTGVKQYRFDQRGFTSIPLSDDAQVPQLFSFELCHDLSFQCFST
jgi:hypothetical protein